MKAVHCIGVLVVDALASNLKRYPDPKEAPNVHVDSMSFRPGGGAANTALALAQLGHRVSVFSKAGDDVNGKFVLSYLEKFGIDTRHVVISSSESTSYTFVGIHPSGDRTFISAPGANVTFSSENINTDALFDTDWLVYQDLFALPKLDGDPAARLLAEAQSRGITTVLDECWGYGPDRATLEAVLPHVDYAIPSFEDLSSIYPQYSAEEMVRSILQLGAKGVILKTGKDGCILESGGEVIRLPSEAGKIVDTTGAGDCFDAGFIAGKLHGLSDRGAAVTANRAAAACIRNIGGAGGIPSFDSLAKDSC